MASSKPHSCYLIKDLHNAIREEFGPVNIGMIQESDSESGGKESDQREEKSKKLKPKE